MMKTPISMIYSSSLGVKIEFIDKESMSAEFSVEISDRNSIFPHFFSGFEMRSEERNSISVTPAEFISSFKTAANEHCLCSDKFNDRDPLQSMTQTNSSRSHESHLQAANEIHDFTSQ